MGLHYSGALMPLPHWRDLVHSQARNEQKGTKKEKKKRRKRNVFDDVRWAPAPLQLED